jgi:hypothetical protein
VKRVVCLLLLGLLCSVCLNAVSAEYVAPNTDSTQALGLHFGNVSGCGISYRYFRNAWGLQTVLGGYNNGSNKYPSTLKEPPHPHADSFVHTDTGKKYFLNLGLNGIYQLKKTNLFNLYLTGGFCWSYYNRKNYHITYTVDTTDTTRFNAGAYSIDHTNKSFLSVGVGPGFEAKLGKFFKLSLELPITYTGRHEFIMYVPQVGLYYYFR